MTNVSNKSLLTFLYFIQGLPYGLQSQFLPIYLHSKTNLSVSKISFLKLLSIPWIFKFAWGPLVDSLSTKRRWLGLTSVILCMACIIGSLAVPPDLYLISIVLFFMNLFTSIQDVAVDATALSLLNTEDLALGNIAQVVGYKLGSVFAGGILTSFIDVIGWAFLFLIVAALYASAALFSIFSSGLRSHENQELHTAVSDGNIMKSEPWKYNFIKSQKNSTIALLYPIFTYNETLWLILFLMSYKLGEQGTLSVLPMYLLHIGVPSKDVSFWLSIVGQALSIVGSVLGGIATKYANYLMPTKLLLQHMCTLRLVPVGCQLLVMMAWNFEIISREVLLYALVASSQLLLILSGIITTATFTMVMQVSKELPKQIQATHHATMSTSEVLGKLMFMSVAGYIVDVTNYNAAFAIFAFLNLAILPMFGRILVPKAHSCQQ